MLGPVLEREVETRAGEVELAKVDVDANQELAARYGVSGIPAVKAFRNGRVVAEFVGAQPPQVVGSFLDGLTGPSPAARVTAELEESGELPEATAALAAGDVERALELLLAEVVEASERSRRERLAQLMVALFEELGHEDPVATSYRRRLATALY
jgi:putative thioredoxin